MKKVTKFIAGLSAAAALLLGVSCTNQADYVEDNTARNAFNVAGLYVEGLDAGYNGSTVTLNVVGVDDDGAKDENIAAVTGKIADSYTKDGTTVGYKSGSAYIKLDDLYLYDGDKMAQAYYRANSTKDGFAPFSANSFECYLTVGSDTIKVIAADGVSVENAKLSVPTSPADTNNASLAKKWVKVSVKDGVGTFSLASAPDEPVNATLTCLTLDVTSLTESSGAYTLKTSDKAGANGKYTLTIKGLEDDQNGIDVQLAGALIAPIEEGKTYTLGDYWYGGPTDAMSADEQEKTPLKQTIKDGSVSWSFYGATASWATINGPAIKIYKFGKENKDKVFFLKTGAAGNFFFPTSTWGKDVELTIDVSKLNKGSDYDKADPVAAVSKVYIDGITLLNAPAINTAGYIAFCEGWVPNNEWGAKTKNKVTELENGAATLYFGESLEYAPGVENFSLAIQMLNPAADSENDGTDVGSKHFWDDASKIGGGTITTAKYSATAYNGRHIMLVVDASNSDKVVAFIANSETLLAAEKITLKVKGIKLENAPAVGAAGYIAFCEDWLPSNVWGPTTTNKVTSLTNGTAVLDFSSTKEIENLQPYLGASKIQILNPASDDDFWADASKVTGGTISVTVPGVPYNNKDVYMVVTLDSASNSAKVKSAKFVLAE